MLLCVCALPAATAQEDGTVSAQDVFIIFGSFVVAVIALFLYLARDTILRRRTDYDEANLGSKQNRDYDKYHSDWQDDYEEYEVAKRDTPGYQDHYVVLGVDPDATIDTIKKRYRRLAREHHPDKTGGPSDEMVRINRAYEVLSDPESRRMYDEEYDGARGEI